MIELDVYIKFTKEQRQKHLDLNSDCLERGGNSTNHRGVLAQFLDTNIPNNKVVLAHACNNPNCSNPKHLYWATQYENIVEDGKSFGTWKNPWERTVEKYGLEEAKKRNARGNKSAGGKAQKGIPKSAEHKRKISESLKKKASVEKFGKLS